MIDIYPKEVQKAIQKLQKMAEQGVL